MEATTILALVAQGLGLLPTIIQTGIDVYDRIKSLEDLATAGANGTATDEQVAAVRAQLDQDLADFNAPLPPEGAATT